MWRKPNAHEQCILDRVLMIAYHNQATAALAVALAGLEQYIADSAVGYDALIYGNSLVVAKHALENERVLLYTLLHEGAHIALGHPWRLKPLSSIDQDIALIAADMEVDAMLRPLEIKLANVLSFGDEKKYIRCPNELMGLPLEAIFHKLMEQPPQGLQYSNYAKYMHTPNAGGGKPSDPNGSSEHDQSGNKSTASTDANATNKPAQGRTDARSDRPRYRDPAGFDNVSDKVKERYERNINGLASFITQCLPDHMKNQGYGSSALQEAIAAMRSGPKVDWRLLLRQWLEANVLSGRDWSRVHKRFISTGVVWPKLKEDTNCAIVIARDTSGSTSTWQHAAVALEVVEITMISGITCLMVDADVIVHRIVELTDPARQLQSIIGRGGTEYRPVFEVTKKLVDGLLPDYSHLHIAGLIYFTDFEVTSDTIEECKGIVDVPTLWCVMPKGARLTPSFGEVIYL